MPEPAIGSEIIGGVRRDSPLDPIRFQDTATIMLPGDD